MIEHGSFFEPQITCSNALYVNQDKVVIDCLRCGASSVIKLQNMKYDDFFMNCTYWYCEIILTLQVLNETVS